MYVLYQTEITRDSVFSKFLTIAFTALTDKDRIRKLFRLHNSQSAAAALDLDVRVSQVMHAVLK